MIPRSYEVECHLSQVVRIILHERFLLESSRIFSFFLPFWTADTPCEYANCTDTLCGHVTGATSALCQWTRGVRPIWRPVLGSKVR